ncbi:pilus assembly protein [Rhodobacter sp. NTK016B]|uniref:TadE/TadG family type IV pilus assembly protein n=1 Tax=Rhodobacter sp. NTK016B TaxID=2759676 RepID=UPI001A8F9123|nr:TadE family protein [Rhodobacter sp. NTK016B]MBN8291352.1 pilus assembly protein [Rhodobacter sp. NTK016B]
MLNQFRQCSAGLGRVRNRARGFVTGARGSVSIEFVLSLPLMLWGLAAMVVFFNGYQARYHAQMAAQTVADIMSRETNLFTANYIEGLNDVFDFLADSNYETRLRVSSVIWDSENERNRLQWSYATRDLAELPADVFELLGNEDYAGLQERFGDEESVSFTNAAYQMPVEDLADRIPPVLPGEALLLVEAFSLWEPFANVGIGQLRFSPVVVVRPRFAPWINFDGIEPVYPESDYEIAWTGGGNEELPDPGDQVDEPDPDDTGQVATFGFDDGVTTGFSQSTITQNGPNGAYLGPFGQETRDNPVTLNVNLPQAGSVATIEFDFYMIDSWDAFDLSWATDQGDSFAVMIDGTPISRDPFATDRLVPFANTRSSAGYLRSMTYRMTMTPTTGLENLTGAYYNDQIWHVVLTIDNAPQNFQLGFSATLNEALGNESWGLDNLTITSAGSGSAPPFTADAANALGADPYSRFPRYSGCPEYRIGAPWLTMTRSDLATGIRVPQRAGGETNLNVCGNTLRGWGWVNASPSLVLNYDNQNVSSTSSALQLRLDDGNNGYTCDTTLAVRDPNGQWYFNDDYLNWNAGVRITNAPTGQYVLFVGTYGNSTCDADLHVDQWTSY